MLRNTPTAYGSLHKTLHWIMALLIFAQFILAWIFTNLPKENPLHGRLFQWHVLIGMTVLILVIARMLWRLNNPPVLRLGTLKPWERKASNTMHLFLYFAMLVMPISGYLMLTGDGNSVKVFGLILPSLIHYEHLEKMGHTVHAYLAYVLLAAVALHIIAAFMHNR